jgi:outer membrane receptor for monomeric catechols
LNVNNPIYGAQPTGIGAPVTNNRGWSDSIAYFATLQSNHFNDRLSILYGYRYDDASSERDDLRFSPTRKSFTEPASTTADRWGVTVRPVEWLSVYHVRSNQADPEATSFRFTNLPPSDPRSNEEIKYARTGELIETGIKAELLNGRLTFTAADFEISQFGFLRNTQEVETLPGGGQITFTRNFLVAGSVFEGYEFEFFGAPTDRLSIFGGYSQIDTITSADPSQINAGGLLENRGIPDYKFSLFGKYDFGNRDKGYYVKGGVVLLGEQWYDIGGGYKWARGKYTVDLTFNNITDEINPLAMVAPGSNTVGPPSQWFITFTARN